MPTIFDPFYSTKSHGSHGLSLARLHNIIEKHHAFIEVDSKGHGTTFTLYFPAVREAEKISTPPISQRRPGEVRVLVVDDEGTVGRLAEKILTQQGHRVLLVNSGEEALEALQASGPFQLILTDIQLGTGMNGITLAETISQSNPEIKVAVMSGDHGEVSKAVSNKAIRAGITKPFTNNELLKLFEKALEK